MNSKKIYMIGICGTAMGALAAMLKEKGHRVLGSDAGVYPPISDFLAERDIPILTGFQAGRLDAEQPDLVIVGNVVRADNPEAVRTTELGLDHTSLPGAMENLFLPGRTPVVAAGTHGKTTTSALMAWLLESAGSDPSFMVGGLCRNFGRGSNYKLGGGPHFVIEGDEYDTAFFDKGAKFFHYRPELVILTGVEFDHADIFADIGAIERAFEKFLALIPSRGRLLVHAADTRAMNLSAEARCPVLSYGLDPGSTVSAGDVRLGPGRVEFQLLVRGAPRGRFTSPMPGRHNLLNTLGCLGLGLEMGLSVPDMARALATFTGVRRRQEIIASIDRPGGEILIMDDFAHHPTAVRETLDALKSFHPDRRLVVAFEPRTATSVRRIFQREYAKAFDRADLIVIKNAYQKQGVSDSERFSSSKLVSELGRRGLRAVHGRDTDEVLASLLHGIRPGDLVVIMSNGGFDGLHQRLIQRLEG